MEFGREAVVYKYAVGVIESVTGVKLVMSGLVDVTEIWLLTSL